MQSSVCALGEVLYLGLLLASYSHAFMNSHGNTESFFVKPEYVNCVKFCHSVYCFVTLNV